MLQPKLLTGGKTAAAAMIAVVVVFGPAQGRGWLDLLAKPAELARLGPVQGGQ